MSRGIPIEKQVKLLYDVLTVLEHVGYRSDLRDVLCDGGLPPNATKEDVIRLRNLLATRLVGVRRALFRT